MPLTRHRTDARAPDLRPPTGMGGPAIVAPCWRLLPARELGCGSPATCWRRLAGRAAAGVSTSSTSRCSTGSASAASWTGRGGLPLTAVVTGANVTDTTMFEVVVDDIPPIRTPAGRRRTRPGTVHADTGYDSHANRGYLRRRGISVRIARRGIESSTWFGRYRWRVERSLSWLSCWRRLQVRWDRGPRPLVVQAPHAQVDDRSGHPARLIGSHEDRHVRHLRERRKPSRVGPACA
jgi:Transposase DDE domain